MQHRDRGLLSTAEASRIAGVTERQLRYLVDTKRLTAPNPAEGSGTWFGFRRSQALAVRAVRALLPLAVPVNVDAIEALGLNGGGNYWLTFDGNLHPALDGWPRQPMVSLLIPDLR